MSVLRVGLALSLLLSGGAARAEDGALPPPARPPWQPLAFPNVERHTRYTPTDEDGRPIVRAESECSASGLVLPLDGVDLTATPRLRWRWRVEEAVAPADERSRAGDDFAARVYVSFVFEPERASLFERARQGMARAIYGETMPGSSLTYVWTRSEPTGARWANPFTGAAQMIAASSGPPGPWREVEVDLLADYEQAFGRSAPTPLFLALMTDSDNGCSRARASYADFRLGPRPAP